MSKRVVFLDADTVGPGVTLGRPGFEHQWEQFNRTRPDQVVERLADAEIAITNKVPIRAEQLDQLPQLKLIAVAATGYDVIDIERCRERGVAVSNIRGYAVNTVPEHTFALITALRRNLIEYREQVLAGEWIKADQFCFFNRPIWDLAGSTLGIIGAGAIGQAVGKIGAAFGMKVIYTDAYAKSVPAPGELVDIARLRETADVITCHCPLTDETRGLIDLPFIKGMKSTAVLINTARGGIIDETDLATAIEQGLIAGAGIDVAATEPPPANSTIMTLAKAPNVILTPHVGWASVGAMQTLFDQLIGNIDAFEQGTPRHLVT
ncbi:MAG: D-2-hydroxyacid dehydrogenase [Burkholderiaceae bacterium]